MKCRPPAQRDSHLLICCRDLPALLLRSASCTASKRCCCFDPITMHRDRSDHQNLAPAEVTRPSLTKGLSLIGLDYLLGYRDGQRPSEDQDTEEHGEKYRQASRWPATLNRETDVIDTQIAYGHECHIGADKREATVHVSSFRPAILPMFPRIKHSGFILIGAQKLRGGRTRPDDIIAAGHEPAGFAFNGLAFLLRAPSGYLGTATLLEHAAAPWLPRGNPFNPP